MNQTLANRMLYEINSYLDRIAETTNNPQFTKGRKKIKANLDILTWGIGLSYDSYAEIKSETYVMIEKMRSSHKTKPSSTESKEAVDEMYNNITLCLHQLFACFNEDFGVEF